MPRYHRMYFDGTLADGAEQWSTSLAFTSVSGSAPASGLLSDWADAIMGAFAASTPAANRLKAWLGSSSDITGIRVYSYPDVGAPADVAGASTVGAISGTGIPDTPAQCALVFSLLTGIPGKSFRGRMYWPRISGSITTDLRDATVGITATDQVAQFFGGIGTLSGGSAGEPAVVSVARGLVTPVTQLGLGDVIDTQRRRRESMVESRNFSAV